MLPDHHADGETRTWYGTAPKRAGPDMSDDATSKTDVARAAGR